MSRKPAPASSKISKIDRPPPVAYARRMKTGAEIEDDVAEPVKKSDESKPAKAEDATPSKAATAGSDMISEGGPAKAAGNAGTTSEATSPKAGATSGSSDMISEGGPAKAAAASDASPSKAAVAGAEMISEGGPATPKAAQPSPSPSPSGDGSKHNERARASTLVMPMMASVGAPPEVPTTAAAPPHASHGTVEDPTHMPSPREIPGGQPADPAAPPGRVPRGDSRSLRRAEEFALVYRVGTFVISRFGSVGQRGQWRVVEYPTSSSASHSYAKECSRFVAEGFSDYRD